LKSTLFRCRMTSASPFIEPPLREKARFDG